MINQMPSQRKNVLKTLTILPLLVLFLYSFNVKTEYSTTNEIITHTDGSTIELIIDKNTSDEALLKMKADLEKDEIDFSYTVVRNENGKITSLSLQVAGGTKATGKFNSSYESSSEDDTISPTYIFVDTDKNSISIGNGKKVDFNSNMKTMVWVSDDDEIDSKEIIVKKVDGKKHITINGKEVDEDDLEDMDLHIEEDSHIFVTSEGNKGSKKIKIKKSGSKGGKKHVFIHSDSDDESDIKVIEKGSSKFFFSNSDEDEPLYIIDGKERNAKAMKKLKPDNIASITVLKGKKASKKYGKKGKNGVIQITTKKN